jgi:integrin alpha FG-GAP repeat containing protein 1
MSSIFGKDVSLLLHPPSQPLITLPLRLGDYNVDGYPDLLIVAVDPSTKPANSLFASKEGTEARILRNIPCSRGLPGCDEGQGRTFVVGTGLGWAALDTIWDVTGASWIDIGDNVSPSAVSPR